MNDLTQEQADRLAKWRWGEHAGAEERRMVKWVWPGYNVNGYDAPTFIAAFRASMQSPMTDRDAELEAKVRWGMEATVHTNDYWRWFEDAGSVRGRCNRNEPWEKALEDASENHCAICARVLDGGGAIIIGRPGSFCDACAETNSMKPSGPPGKFTITRGPFEAARCPSGHQRCMLCGHGIAKREMREVSGTVAWVAKQNFGCEWSIAIEGLDWPVRLDAELVREQPRCTTLFVPAVGDNVCATFAIGAPGEAARLVRLEVIRADLTQAEATAEAKRLWGDGYAFPAAGKAPLAVGCPGKAHGTGKTFREALQRAETSRVLQALATAFGAVGCAAVRERNKAIGQAMMQPPDWAYPAAWRNAVMAAVEWANNNANPIGLWDLTIPLSERLTSTLRGYHNDRHFHCQESALKRRGGGTFAAAVCGAYERGRPGGGR